MTPSRLMKAETMSLRILFSKSTDQIGMVRKGCSILSVENDAMRTGKLRALQRPNRPTKLWASRACPLSSAISSSRVMPAGRFGSRSVAMTVMT
ncbi:hypothetical protein D3C72_1884580 [compost metagenome]